MKEKLSPFLISEGLLETQVEQLILHTNTDPEIKQYTDDSNRFSTLENFQSWLCKRRKIFTLTDEDGLLHGIIWFGKKPVSPDYTNTFAIRIYQSARGTRVAYFFMERVFEKFINSPDYDGKGFWLEVKHSNNKAVRLYEKFGFIRLRDSGEKRFYILDPKKPE